MTISAIYAGSFDPITIGHLDIIKTGVSIFDKLIVAVAYNSEKKGFLPVKTRVELIKKSTAGLGNIEVCSFEGLTVEFAKKNNVSVLIRGIRNFTDFEYENQLAQINVSLDESIKTVFIPAKPEHFFISSTAVRELAFYKKNLSKYVSKSTAEFLYKNFR